MGDSHPRSPEFLESTTNIPPTQRTSYINRTESSATVHVLLTYQKVSTVAVVQELAEEVKVRHERRLKDNRHVGGVEQLDGVGTLLPAVLLVFHLV